MAEKNWGHCQHCKYFASPSQVPIANEEARCLQPQLARFELKVFGASGCRAFELRQGLERSLEEPQQHVMP